MCTIDGCEGKPFAKGLCSKHYMRLRRAGDPNVTRKPGPKPVEYKRVLEPEEMEFEGVKLNIEPEWTKPVRDYWKDAFPHWSPRTRERFLQALRLIEAMELPNDQTSKVNLEMMQRARRRNGDINVSAMLDMATMTYAMSRREAIELPADEEGTTKPAP
jgi:hypothetical protein